MIDGSTLFAGTNGNGVYRSSDNGDTWKQINTGLTDNFVDALAFHDQVIFAGSSGAGGVDASMNNGDQWVLSSTGLTDPHVICLVMKLQ